MNCQGIQPNLWEYSRDLLSEELMASTKEHLRICPACRALQEEMKQVDLELDRYEGLAPSPGFDQKLNARLDALDQPRSRLAVFTSAFKPRYAWAMAILLLTTTGLWFAVRHQSVKNFNSSDSTLRVEEKKLDVGAGVDNTQAKLAQPQDSSTGNRGEKNQEEESQVNSSIPEEDWAVVENYDLLQNYDILKKFDIADMQQDSNLSVEAN